MSIASEASGMPNELQTALSQGLNNLSRDQTVTFTQYTKSVIEQDGYVFWVANSSVTLTAKGSLHYSTERDQSEDQTIGVNSVILSSEKEITAFNSVGAGTLWIGAWPVDGGGTIQIAFSSRGSFYEQSGVWHYAGFAVYPALQSQLIASSTDLPVGPIVSNSLPIFLAAGPLLAGLPQSTCKTVPLYASFLVPENIVPPYGVVHIEPGMTEALQAAPAYYQGTGTSPGPYPMQFEQLTKDYVTITLYGLNNQQALQWFSALQKYSLYTENFGFMSSPAIQDDKRTQPEIAAIAMRKSFTFHASYNMATADALARMLIVQAAITFTPET